MTLSLYARTRAQLRGDIVDQRTLAELQALVRDLVPAFEALSAAESEFRSFDPTTATPEGVARVLDRLDAAAHELSFRRVRVASLVLLDGLPAQRLGPVLDELSPWTASARRRLESLRKFNVLVIAALDATESEVQHARGLRELLKGRQMRRIVEQHQRDLRQEREQARRDFREREPRRIQANREARQAPPRRGYWRNWDGTIEVEKPRKAAAEPVERYTPAFDDVQGDATGSIGLPGPRDMGIPDPDDE